MKLKDYKIGDAVQVSTTNPEKDELCRIAFWHDGVVTGIQTIHPTGGARHEPYPMVMVKFKRTYGQAEPIYYMLGKVKVFDDYELSYYEKESVEGFIYDVDIRLKA